MIYSGMWLIWLGILGIWQPYLEQIIFIILRWGILCVNIIFVSRNPAPMEAVF